MVYLLNEFKLHQLFSVLFWEPLLWTSCIYCPWSESGTVVNPILSWSTVSPGPPRDGAARRTRKRSKVCFFCKSIDIS